MNMNQNQLKNDKALENFRVFPYIAWGLVFSFAFFVYTITVDLKEVAADLKSQSDRLEAKINATTTPAEMDFTR